MNSRDVNDMLKTYFYRIFPFDCFYKWLSYGDDDLFKYREFAFNFDNERFLRHKSYHRINQLKSDVKYLKPVKIDIGAVYNVPPSKESKQMFFYPVQKELIFDIDMTDYDDVRTCCSGVNMCYTCWEYIVLAVKILDTALREDYGFKNILWNFSGRRGIHCWVCDSKARFLRGYIRICLAKYLQIVTGGNYMKKKVTIGTKMHYSVKRALEFIQPKFIRMSIKNQDILGTDERVIKFLGILENDEMRLEVKNLFELYDTSYDKWNAFVKFFKKQIELKNEKWCKTPYLIEEIMLQYTYPRLDIQVTLGMTHLLKAPFCVHPSTGKIGVPIDPKQIESFDPYKIPTIGELLNEIDEFDRNAIKNGMSLDELRKIQDIKKTSLKHHLQIFEDFIINLENSPYGINVNSDENLEDDPMIIS